ncbi:MAG: acylphosphatase [Isosphaeraceae bacterium]
MANERRRTFYRGRVQGVGFRMATRSLARGFAVSGFVRNLEDGRVEVVAEGESDELDRFQDAMAEEFSEQILGVETLTDSHFDELFEGFTIRV